MSRFISSSFLLVLIIYTSVTADHHRHRKPERDQKSDRDHSQDQKSGWDNHHDWKSDRDHHPDLVAKAITLPYERAKPIRACQDCTGTALGKSSCMAARECTPARFRCSDLQQFADKRFTTVTSHHCKLDSGMHGRSLYCCERGSKESLNILTLRARPNQYPHHVYLSVKSRDVDTNKTHNLNCGGTIIDKDWIITATHCTQGPPAVFGGKPLKAIQITAIVGQNHIHKVERENRYEIDMGNIRDHPRFSYSPFLNDISLLKLKRPIMFSGYVQPLRIANPNFKEIGDVEIVGFGKTDLTRSLGVLFTETASIMDNDRCTDVTKLPKPDTLMCVGGDDEAIPNQGDSGGPAICRDVNNNPVLCGIISNIGENAICDRNVRKRLNLREGEALPAGCGYPPAVFTRVSKYYDWIMSVMRR